jgi:SagB-type dehydrogenase family enzyme
MIKLERQTLKKLAGNSAHSAINIKSSLSEMFHENTKLTPLSGRAYGQHIANILRSPTANILMNSPYKLYNLMDQIELTSLEPQTELEKTIAARRSHRQFSGEAISKEELSKLLFFSYGRTDHKSRFRAVASGGALYPLELYILALNVEGLERGIYHYNIENHCLDVVSRGDFWPAAKSCLWLSDIEEPEKVAMIVVVTAIFPRNTMKYLDRGYRLILMEAGEVAQNMSLLAISAGLGALLLGGFIDNALSELLGIDGLDEAPLLPIVIGRKPGGKSDIEGMPGGQG